MLQENYGLSVKQLVTIVACENGETQVKELPPKKEFFMKLMSYISEYQEQYGQETIIRG
jgi:genome maintenance exonuclease 1